MRGREGSFCIPPFPHDSCAHLDINLPAKGRDQSTSLQTKRAAPFIMHIIYNFAPFLSPSLHTHPLHNTPLPATPNHVRLLVQPWPCVASLENLLPAFPYRRKHTSRPKLSYPPLLVSFFEHIVSARLRSRFSVRYPSPLQ